MTSLQIFLTYAVSWWLVLFMVLPHRATPPLVPGSGHASGAPEHPRVGRKLLWTSGFAIIPTLLIYLAIGFFAAADAADEIYHVGGKPEKSTRCKSIIYHAPADIRATDGVGAGGKEVLPATAGGSNSGEVAVDLAINGDPYVKQPSAGRRNTTSPNSYLGLGKVAVQADGTTTLNGKPLVAQTLDDCDDTEGKQ